MFSDSERHNVTWFYPKICGFQDDVQGIADVVPDSYGDEVPNLLYIHIPFCESFCAYCACFKELLRSYTSEELQRFAQCLVKEMGLLRAGNDGRKIPVKYVQFGGGTPSCLDNSALETIFAGLHENFDLSGCEGISFEGNVMSLRDLDKLRLLKSAGVTRVSFGVQTFNAILRRKLGIRAKLADIFATVENLEVAGIESFAIDLIYNLPDQSMESLENDLETACREVGPTQIQTYQFNQFNNTMLDRRIREGKFGIIPSQEREGEMMRFIRGNLAELGYGHQTLINLFSKDDLKPWTGIELSLGNNRVDGSHMIGLGPGSMSYGARANYRNVCSVRAYVEALERDELPIECGHRSLEEEKRNKVMVNFPAFTRLNRDAVPDDEVIAKKLQSLLDAGLVAADDNEYRLTDDGFDWAGNISYLFFSDAEVKRNKASYYLAIKHRKNPFNQDDMNIVSPARTGRS